MNTSNVKGSSMTTASWKSGDSVSDQFPAGLRVLVVDDDPTCLMIVERMLKRCHYEVTTCNRAEKALASLQANRNGFDIVISDVHMPDMDGFKLLELVGLEMDLPVIMMSADDGKSVVMKGVTHGACDYLIKPIRIEELKNIWQHVIRKRKGGWKEMEQSASVDEGDSRLNNNNKQQPYEDPDYTSSATEGSWKNSKRRKDEEDELDDASGLKKPRVVWSIELHQQFVAAVNQLGIDKAVPKKILELMNVPGLTRENVASHLQKYRLYLRRLSGVSQHHHGSFMNPQDPNFGPMSSFSGLDLQTLAVAGQQLQPQSLASLQAAAAAAAGFGRPSPKSAMLNQRNIFSFDHSNFKFGDLDCHVSKPMNLLHGIPTALSARSFENNTVQKGTHLLMQQPMGESQSQPQSRAPQPNGSRFPMNHHGTELPGNSFPVLINPNLGSKARYQEEVSSSKGGMMSGLSETQQTRSKDWVDAYLNHNNSSNIRGNLNSYQALSSSSQRGGGYVGNDKIKSEVVPARIGLFQEHFGQEEDLMSVFLKQQGGVSSVSNEFDFDGYSIDNIPV